MRKLEIKLSTLIMRYSSLKMILNKNLLMKNKLTNKLHLNNSHPNKLKNMLFLNKSKIKDQN